MKNAFFFETKIGKLSLCQENNVITKLYFNNNAPLDFTNHKTALLEEAAYQIQAYLAGTLKVFSFPYQAKGTAFQKKVWSSLLTIPYGETRSYKDIATLINRPTAYRAVGSANNKNQLPLIIPCHRVIGSDQTLVGYAGGLKIKEFLLRLEAKNR